MELAAEIGKQSLTLTYTQVYDMLSRIVYTSSWHYISD